MSVYKSVSYIKRLRQPYHGVIYGAVSVRVIFTHYFTDYTSRFFMRLVRSHSKAAHAVKNSSVNRLKPVSYIGKGTAYDNAHGVIDIGVLHFFVYLVLYQLLIF